MGYNKKATKDRYFKKIYDNAKIVKCACGCGRSIKDKDKYGRNKSYINGHGTKRYEDPTQHKREWNHRNRKARYDYRTLYSYRRKAEFIEKAGGKCYKCGIKYNGINAPIFDFHHVDPSTKAFNFTISSLVRYNRIKLEAEVKKCRLYCSNCHRLLHSNSY